MNNIVFKNDSTKITSISKKFTFLESAEICKSMTHGKLLNKKTFKVLKNLPKTLENLSEESFFRVEYSEDKRCFSMISKPFKVADFDLRVCPGNDLYDQPYPTLCLFAADNSSRNLNYLFFLVLILILILAGLFWRRSQKCTDENQSNENVSLFFDL